ncbi:tRNA selenocysteine 1-associated protein 1-like isoform X1 [Phymastichus coffea]|uniref:tRNA selenocysteine 1-associated protein 1-like isoform X1 n=1 Tax=Phymastichus coffea TaxID=108790 RepID=UPI00273BBE66|nr:tRNA selenocysteine 1-associated protein 1-like isoform X1 [Phymastichus coffea]
MSVPMVLCQLWMGGLEPYMTESFIMNAFHKMGEQPQIVKVMRNRYTGEPAGYCFVHFPTDEMALDAMHKLNGKPVPGSSPQVRFRLNHASTTGKPAAEREYSIWVGDLSTDVDDYSLYRLFAAKYNSIRTAKVILDSSGFSKGYGFVRFASEEEQKDSLITMNGYRGLGTKSLKICNAVPRPWNKVSDSNSAPSDYSSGMSSESYNYYDPSSYWNSYSAWQQGYYESEPTSDGYSNYVSDRKPEEDELELIEHSIPFDGDKSNREIIEQDYNLWDALESSKWIPCDTLELCY